MSDGSFSMPAIAEEVPPYRSGSIPATAGSPRAKRRTRIHHLRELKERGERWPMLTAYDRYTYADNISHPDFLMHPRPGVVYLGSGVGSPSS